MEQPPVMISTKDLSYLSDIFEWNFLSSKVSNSFCKQIVDPKIKDLIESVVKVHTSICKDLIKIMEANNE